MAKKQYTKGMTPREARPRSERLRALGVHGSTVSGTASSDYLALKAAFSSHAADSDIHVTTEEKAAWDLVASLFGVDVNGDVYLKDNRGFWTNSFLSSRGADPEAGSGGGVDMAAVWGALGAETSEQINASHIPALSISKITGLQEALNDKLSAITRDMVESVLTGTVTSHDHDGMYAPLSGGVVPSQYLPSYVDDVLEYASKSVFPASGEAGKIYVALDTNLTYRWGGSSYVEISPSLALGYTSSTAYPGNEGAANASAIATLQGYFTGGAANKVAHALTISYDGGTAVKFDGSTALSVIIPSDEQRALWDKICALFDIDADGNVYVTGNRGFWTSSFLSARGADPEAGQGGTGGGIDEDELWTILGTSGSQKIDASHIPALGLLSGTVSNAQLANSSITVAGVEVPLGSAVTAEQLATALNLDGYLPLTGGTLTGLLTLKYSRAGASMLDITNTAGGEVYFRMFSGNNYAGAFLANHTSYGTAIYNERADSDKRYLGITNSGVPHFQGNPLLHSGNYTSYTVTKTGGGASGTWPISISGDAATLGGYGPGTLTRLIDYYASKNLTAVGWYRIFTATDSNARGITVMLYLWRSYTYVDNEAYIFNIAIAYDGKVSITQTSGGYNGHLIDKIRVVWINSGACYIDFHIGVSSQGNKYYVSGKGVGTFQVPAAVSETVTGNVTEFSTVNGVSSNMGFTGALNGIDASKYMYHYRQTGVNIDTISTLYPRIIEASNPAGNKPGTSSWVQVMQWGSGDGAYGFQMANSYAVDQSVYYRAKIAGTWYGWKTFLDTNNYASTLDARYVKKAGDTMTGTLYLNTLGTSNFNEGIRANRVGSDKWASVTIGGAANSTSGTSVGTWIMGASPSSNSYNLVIAENGSANSTGLTLGGNGSSTLTWKGNKIWHAGNDGTGSGLDADLLDGWFSAGRAWNPSSTISLDDYTNNNALISVSWDYARSKYVAGGPYGDYFSCAATVLTLPGMFLPQLYSDYNGQRHFLRVLYASRGWSAWNEIVTASRIGSMTAGAATKLATARTIWGQSFDGTADVSGSLTGVGNITGGGDLNIIASHAVILNAGSYNAAMVNNVFRPGGNSGGQVDLGNSSYKWRHLYLAGGANIDGAINNLYIYSGTDTTYLDSGVHSVVFGGNKTYANKAYYFRPSYRDGVSTATVAIENMTSAGEASRTHTFDASGNATHIGNVQASGNLICGREYNKDISSSFRTSIFGSTTSGSRIKTARNNAPSISGFDTQWSPGLAWAIGDTHAWLNVDYNAANKTVYVGGGNGDKLNWTAKIWHSGNSNLLTVNWAANNLMAAGQVSANNGFISSKNNTYALTDANTLSNGILAVSTKIVGHNTVQPMITWSNNVSSYGFITRYSISSVRPFNDEWGRMRLAVGANDTGTRIGCYLDIDGNGLVSISKALHVGTDATISGNLTTSGTIYSATGIWSDGYVSANGVDTTSDRRFKDGITPLGGKVALTVIKALKPSTWTWNALAKVKGRSAGFVAQDVAGILPDAIRETGEDKHLALNYQMLHAYEVAALQEHDDEIQKLRRRVAELENKIKNGKWHTGQTL